MLKLASKSILGFGLFFCLMAILPGVALAQTSRDVESTRRITVPQENSQPVRKLSKRQARKKLKKTYSAYFNNLVGEYEDRMEANARQHKKTTKELRKPQYSDPSYFGHKKPPKKHKTGKKKLCKECHMWH